MCPAIYSMSTCATSGITVCPMYAFLMDTCQSGMTPVFGNANQLVCSCSCKKYQNGYY